MANVAVVTPKCQGIETLLKWGENICWHIAPWVDPVEPDEEIVAEVKPCPSLQPRRTGFPTASPLRKLKK